MTLDQIREIIEAATPGPWTAQFTSVWSGEELLFELDWGSGASPGNTQFVAAARDLLPALLTAVEDMADELQAAKDADPYICKAESVDRLLAVLEAIKLP